MRVLKQRILTALILIPIFLLILFFLPPFPFLILTALLVFISAWEWSNLMGLKSITARIIYLSIILLCCILVFFIPYKFTLQVALIWWLISISLLILYSQGKDVIKPLFIKGLVGVLVLVPCWFAL